RRIETPREAAASRYGDCRCAQPRGISWEGSVGDTTTRPYPFRDSCGVEWISSSGRHDERSSDDHGQSFGQRPHTRQRGHLLLHRRCPIWLAVFCSQISRLSESPRLSGILVGMESGFCLSGGKGCQGVAAYPKRRSPGEAFLTAKKRLCKVKGIKSLWDHCPVW